MAGHSRVLSTLPTLPVTPTSFVGRRAEASEAKRLLGTEPVVTIVGPGGVGKTRLALHVAGEVQRVYPDGVWLVELADLRDGSLLAHSVAERLGVKDRTQDPVAAVTSHLSERRLLLVLDNCEHLIDECARFLGLLVRSCPGLHVLATSRQSLRISGEVSLQLPPLSAPQSTGGTPAVPSAEEALSFDSVRLFADRARAVLPSFELDRRNASDIAQLCHRLDGLPLAIELAAVRVRILTPAQIDDRLDTRYRLLNSRNRSAPARQQTLQALVDWSYHLCTVEERLIWARVSVFSGGFTLDAAEWVCSDGGVAEADVLDILDSLVDKSVLTTEDDAGVRRFRVLETIREYGAARLAESGAEDFVRQRHRDWFADMTQAFATDWLGAEQVRWVSRLAREHPNLRVALDYCLTEGQEPTTALAMAIALEDYWAIRGLNIELRHWLGRGLALADAPSPQRLAGLRLAGWVALVQDDLEAGLPMLDEAARLAEEVGGPTDKPYLTHGLSLAALVSGDLQQAATFADTALAGFRQARDLRGELFSLIVQGLALGLADDRDRGLALLEESVSMSTQVGDIYWRGWALWAVSVIAMENGDLARADAAGKQALAMQRELDNRLGIVVSMDSLAWVAAKEGRPLRAAALFGIADRTASDARTGTSKVASLGALHDRNVRLTRSALDDDEYEEHFRTGRSLQDDVALDFALEIERPYPQAAKKARATSTGPLTRREQEIAELVASGLTNKHIAARLVLSTRTVETHVDHILRKLGFRSRAQIAAWMTAKNDRG